MTSSCLKTTAPLVRQSRETLTLSMLTPPEQTCKCRLCNLPLRCFSVLEGYTVGESSVKITDPTIESLSVIKFVAMRKAINHLKKVDPVMRAIIERLGPCKIDYGEPSFASLSETIVYQQLHGKAAATIFRRFLDLAGRPLTPQGVIRLTDEQMRSAGLSKQKLSYLRSLAELTHSGELNFEQ